MEHLQKILALLELSIETANKISIQSKRYRRFKNAYGKRDRSKKRPVHFKWMAELFYLQMLPTMASTQMNIIMSQPKFEPGGIEKVV